jgi:formylglycine-generating enzyme
MEGLTPCYGYSTFGTDPDDWPAGWDQAANHLNVSCDWEANGYRLPTEMEWMYASLGGQLSQGFTYSGSDNIENVAWYDGNSGNSIHQIGLKMPNELGLYDMSGNLWEWCWDIHGDYPAEAQSNPTGPDTGDYRDLRGGAYGSSANACENAHRGYTLPTVRQPEGGFRVIRRYN